MSKIIRCGIYTRKSTEEGLEQDFNSLHAQREACEAFVKSQRHEGWQLIRDSFDDGGYSGGTMERPGITRLLEMVKAGRIDVIVVYKVDRLTRSLADFARLIELFDANKVSFVSVTQQFNTTSSMGRLTLNVLLSFAQFEREVTAERIRDKFAASKKRGMWMGGTVPIGYDVRDRHLIVNEAEAGTVNRIFDLYRGLGTVRKLKTELDRVGIVTKLRRAPDGAMTGGKPFSSGHLYQLLANRIYIGEIVHKGAVYPGQHSPIIDRNLWDAVQARRERRGKGMRSPRRIGAQSLLSGLIYDDAGHRMHPTHASRNGRHYHYYISTIASADRQQPGKRLSIPARELENIVIESVCGFLSDGLRVVDALKLQDARPDVTGAAIAAASEIAKRVGDASPENRELLRSLLHKVSVCGELLNIEVSRIALRNALVGQTDEDSPTGETNVILAVPVQFRRRGVETKLVVRAADVRSPDPNLIALVARAHLWLGDLVTEKVASIREIGREEGVDESDVSRFLPLAFLAPDIVEMILTGQQPSELTAEKLKRIGMLPLMWEDQRRLLGLPA